MEERNITINIDEARKWFYSGSKALKEIALQAFNRYELMYDFTGITTFMDACDKLGLNYNDTLNIACGIAKVSKASAAAFKLDIVRRALNFGQDLYLTEDPEYSYIHYPINPFIIKGSNHYNDEINSGKMEIIGKIKTEDKEYNVLGGGVGFTGSAGLGSFTYDDGVGSANGNFGFLGCANKEIAKHFGKYFGMLITEAKYAGIIKDFEILETKYNIDSRK